MAGPCSIKILLLWAAIIGVADCQTSSAITNPGNTSKETTITSTSNQTVSQALGNLTQTSPPITQSITTVTPTTEAPTPPQCSYTVTPIKFGFQIKFINSPLGNYTINVKEEGQNQIGGKAIFQHSNPNITTHNITALKPCTDYEHNVTFDHAGTKILCDHSDSKTTVKTMEMTEGDIKRGSCIPGYLCYKSDWNIISVQINNIEAVQCPSDNKTFCIRPGYDDICTNLMTTFTQEKCVKSSFNHIQHISAAEFLNSNEINLTPPTELPAKIEANLPPKCTDLTIDYICSDSYNKTKLESELEPFTDYTCTGQIKENDVTIKNTPAIQFKIDCDLNIATQRDSTNTSIELNWTTTSQNCQEVPKLDELSYNCSCHPVGSTSDKKRAKPTVNKQRPGGTCHFSGLKPYTDYTCEVQPIYNNNSVLLSTKATEKTEPGVPDEVPILALSVPEHNAIKVTCPRVNNFRGPKKLYSATLRYDDVIQKTKLQDKCEFTFKDLSYSTTYDVEVVAFNGHLYSKTKTAHVDTLYNDKFVIRLLVHIIIILISVAVFCVVYKIHMKKLRNSQDVNEDVMLESTGIYANAPES
ncbi:receptor-type tyrosine-protein phosphatase C-like [Thunnus maccoyii]|uniref:receptor-type tyrosine-protein phosphatase C-like n=1 Tax=Thunnus maccoyii TaxID=8240 RepID=UPI001C4C2DFB|nr:receptor-type tyrosine-protein phosphatase C-like [Thunnus maccoyii]